MNDSGCRQSLDPTVNYVYVHLVEMWSNMDARTVFISSLRDSEDHNLKYQITCETELDEQ